MNRCLRRGRSWCAAASVLAAAGLAIAPLAASQAPALDKPDFSGRWVLESSSAADADVPHAVSIRQSLVTTNVRGEPMPPFFSDITIAGEFPSGQRSETYRIGGVGGMVSGDLKTRVSVQWEGAALVIEGSSYTGQTPRSGQWDERRQVWSFDSTGRLVAAITTSSSDGPSKTSTLVYRRQ